MTPEQKLIKKYYVDNKKKKVDLPPLKEDKVLYKPEYVDKALHDTFDIQERALVNFILLGDIADKLKHFKATDVGEIEMALPYKAITPEVVSNFKTWQFKVEEYGYSWTFSPDTFWDIKIPIRLFLYEKYPLFDNPDRVWGSVDSFFIPNPWEKYWPSRNLIRGKLLKGSL